MTITKLSVTKSFCGLSSDAKPDLKESDAGSTFSETDTGHEYLWTGKRWTHSLNPHRCGPTKYEYDANGNCIYKGENVDPDAAETDATWTITKYGYDQNNNCESKQIKVGSWNDRDQGW